MKGLILSGGAGTRLRPITHTSAKQLVPVANKPILFYGLEAMREAGIAEVGIVVGDTHAEVEAAVGDGSRWGLRVTYLRQEAPLGLAHAVLIAEDYLGAEPFVMYLGDNLLKDGIVPFVERFAQGAPDAMILLQHVPDPQSYGVAEISDGAVVRLVEKPAAPRSDLALVGVYLFTAQIFESVKAISPSARGELEITDAIQHMVDRGLQVQSHVVTGWWKDTGRLEDMLEANRLILGSLVRDVRGETVDCSDRGARRHRSRQPAHALHGTRARHDRSRLRAHRRLHRPLHGDLPRGDGRPRRDRALHHPRQQPHLGAQGATLRQPDRQRRHHLPRRRPPGRLPLHGGRLEPHRRDLTEGHKGAR